MYKSTVTETVVFTKHMSEEICFIADVDEIRPQYQDSTVDGSAIFTSSVIRSIGPSVGATIDQIDNLTLSGSRWLERTRNPLVLRPEPALRHHPRGLQRIRSPGSVQDLRRRDPQRRIRHLDRRRGQRDAGHVRFPQ